MDNIDNLVETYMEWFYNENTNTDDELRFLVECILQSNERQRMIDVMTDLNNQLNDVSNG
jgi:hypothetical protein